MESFTVKLEGGAPWGFSIQGGLDHRSPLRVGKVRAGGHASSAGLLAGDYILTINGEDCKSLKHLQSQQLIKNSVNTVTLVCTKVRPGITSPALSQTFTYNTKGKETTPVQPPAQGVLKPQQASTSSTGIALDDITVAATTSPPSSAQLLDVKNQSLNVADQCQSHSKSNGYGHAPVDTALEESSKSHQQSTMEPSTDMSTETPIEEQPVFQVHLSETPAAYDLNSTSNVVEQPVSQVRRSDEAMVYHFDGEPQSSTPPNTDPSTTVQVYRCDENKAIVEESVICLDQAQQQPLMYTFSSLTNNEAQDTPIASSSNPDVAPIKNQEEEATAAVVANKDPGWYKQMFQQLHNTVEDDSLEEPMYDSRGLRVRTNSISNTEQSVKVSEKLTQEDTYVKDKDKDHPECENGRRLPSEYTTPVLQSSSYGNEYKPSVGHIHPLLRDDSEERLNPCNTVTEDQPRVVDRMDATKLHEALKTSTMMGKLEQEGVPPHLLPAMIQTKKETEVSTIAKSVEKPPPGKKAKSLFDFCGHGPRELSFKKGEILDLHHTVDENWLEASLGGSKGIIPHRYVQVLTVEQYREVVCPPPKPSRVAKALFDFQGQSERELTFKKGDEVLIERKVDSNWYEGVIGGARGIFPISYIQS